MSNGKIEFYHRVTSNRVRDNEGRGVRAFGVSDSVNPSEGVADILNIGEIGGMTDG